VQISDELVGKLHIFSEEIQALSKRQIKCGFKLCIHIHINTYTLVLKSWPRRTHVCSHNYLFFL